MKKQKKVKEVYLQDKVLDFTQIKSKHSELFEIMHKFNDQFLNFSVYENVRVYKYLNKNQSVLLR